MDCKVIIIPISKKPIHFFGNPSTFYSRVAKSVYLKSPIGYLNSHMYVASENTIINIGDWYIMEDTVLHNGSKDYFVYRCTKLKLEMITRFRSKGAETKFYKIEFTTDISLGLPKIDDDLIACILDNKGATMRIDDVVNMATGVIPDIAAKETITEAANRKRTFLFNAIDQQMDKVIDHWNDIPNHFPGFVTPKKSQNMYSITFDNLFSVIVTADKEEEAIALGTNWALEQKKSYKSVAATMIVGEVK